MLRARTFKRRDLDLVPYARPRPTDADFSTTTTESEEPAHRSSCAASVVPVNPPPMMATLNLAGEMFSGRFVTRTSQMNDWDGTGLAVGGCGCAGYFSDQVPSVSCFQLRLVYLYMSIMSIYLIDFNHYWPTITGLWPRCKNGKHSGSQRHMLDKSVGFLLFREVVLRDH